MIDVQRRHFGSGEALSRPSRSLKCQALPSGLARPRMTRNPWSCAQCSEPEPSPRSRIHARSPIALGRGFECELATSNAAVQPRRTTREGGRATSAGTGCWALMLPWSPFECEDGLRQSHMHAAEIAVPTGKAATCPTTNTQNTTLLNALGLIRPLYAP
jgi:hypothetical protein